MSLSVTPASGKRKLLYYAGALALTILVTAGIFAKNGWFPTTDPLSGKRTGWFGKPLAKNAPNSWNPIAPDPTPTPVALSKEYIYAGQRLLSVVDANAQEVPPSDLAIWRPSSGEWWVLNGAADGNYSTYSAGTWGTSGDKPEPGDYDGDGKTDFCIFRPSTGYWWVIESSSGSQYSFQFGTGTDTPAPADYDGDGKTDAAFFRPDDPSAGNATFYIRRSSDGSYYATQFGLSTDIPASADFDGDGKADVGVWRDSNKTFYSLNSSNGSLSYFAFTQNSSAPVPADYDGDGKADYAIRESGSNNWIIRNSGTSTTDTIAWQNSGDIAVQNDYDGDGKCDIAVWRPTDSPSGTLGYWFIRPSSNPSSPRYVQWGTTGDIPEPAYFRR